MQAGDCKSWSALSDGKCGGSRSGDRCIVAISGEGGADVIDTSGHRWDGAGISTLISCIHLGVTLRCAGDWSASW